MDSKKQKEILSISEDDLPAKMLETAEHLIEQMKDKGIKFEKFSESDAKKFLEQNSYYKKISSYQNNFMTGIKDGKKKFFDLDFAYLVELSILDMEFRFLVMKMCLNFEHALKVLIINKCLERKEDAYNIIEDFFRHKPSAKDDVIKHANNGYCRDLMQANKNGMPLWVYLEVTSFGGLCHLCKFLSKKDYFMSWELDIFFNVRNFRNAAAHSHCLFSQLIRTNSDDIIYKVRNYVAGFEEVSKMEKKNSLKSRCINDFVTLLFSFEYYIKSDGIIRHTKEDIDNLFNKRMLINSHYFSNCNTVKNAYKFVKKILDKWCRN